MMAKRLNRMRMLGEEAQLEQAQRLLQTELCFSPFRFADDLKVRPLFSQVLRDLLTIVCAC